MLYALKTWWYVNVTDIMDSDHLPIMFSILDLVRMREALDSVEKLTRLGALSKHRL
jgi:hypothetical protein